MYSECVHICLETISWAHPTQLFLCILNVQGSALGIICFLMAKTSFSLDIVAFPQLCWQRGVLLYLVQVENSQDYYVGHRNSKNL